jgi:hypothetical protein
VVVAGVGVVTNVELGENGGTTTTVLGGPRRVDPEVGGGAATLGALVVTRFRTVFRTGRWALATVLAGFRAFVEVPAANAEPVGRVGASKAAARSSTAAMKPARRFIRGFGRFLFTNQCRVTVANLQA